jgi:hypothetical protein
MPKDTTQTRAGGRDDTGRLAFRVVPFCEAIGISQATFYLLQKAGIIRTITIGRRRLVPAEEAHRIAREGCELPTLTGRRKAAKVRA